MDITEVKSKGDNVLNINRSRMRAVYWRPHQTKDGVQWVKTTPLPADPQSVAYYYAKGFRAKPPEEPKEPEPDDGLTRCPFCEKEVKDAFGLQSHLRVHISKTTKENTK